MGKQASEGDRIVEGCTKAGSNAVCLSHESFQEAAGFLENWLNTVQGYLQRRIRCREDSEDLVYTIALKTLRELPQVRRKELWGWWLWRIVRCQCSNYYRTKSRSQRRTISLQQIILREEATALLSDRNEANPEWRITTRSIAERLWAAALDICNEKERIVLWLHVQGMTDSLIAHHLALSLSTIRSHRHRARTRILRYLQRSDPEFLEAVGYRHRRPVVRCPSSLSVNPVTASAHVMNCTGSSSR